MTQVKRSLISTIKFGLIGIGFSISTPMPAAAEDIAVYTGAVRYPDFGGRDKSYAYYRTRITNEMRTGPNFAGRYAIVTLGCGTGCSRIFVADVSTGRVYDFPYGGEVYHMLSLTYGVKSDYLTAKWINEEDRCIVDDMAWDGARFVSNNKRVIGDSSRCHN